MAASVLKLPGVRELPRSAPRSVRSIMDTVQLTPEGCERWKRPPFQRELRITPRVQELIEQLRGDGGVVPGIITLGKLGAETYIIDGQHRIEAFKQSGLATGYADVRICTFENMGEMGEEFVCLNSSLVRMKNDDILRGLEGTNEHLAFLKRRCSFLGYDNIRTAKDGQKARYLLSMATAVRVWFGSSGLSPTTGGSSMESVKMLDNVQTERLVVFLHSCFEAWGSDRENFKLWCTLNLGVLIWLYHRAVLAEHRPASQRGGVQTVTLTRDQWVSCLMALSSNARYSEWLIGRNLSERDRSPCYMRIREIIVPRLIDMGIRAPKFPNGSWATNR